VVDGWMVDGYVLVNDVILVFSALYVFKLKILSCRDRRRVGRIPTSWPFKGTLQINILNRWRKCERISFARMWYKFTSVGTKNMAIWRLMSI
jgi:hypothetical protein